MRALVILAGSALAGLLMAACGDSMAPSAGGTEGRAVVIDARAGRVGSVRLGAALRLSRRRSAGAEPT